MHIRGKRTIWHLTAGGVFILFFFTGTSFIPDMYGSGGIADHFPKLFEYLLVSSASASPGASEASNDAERGMSITKEETIPETLQPPGTSRPTIPDFRPPKGMHDIVLPPVSPPPEREESLSGKLRIHIGKIRFSGNTAVTDDELQKVSAPYENRTITSEELEALRHKLTLVYVEKGYINSGAVIPDQKVIDGTITVQIIEGRLSGIEITGNKRLRAAYIKNRITLAAETPFNINQLHETLLLLQEGPLIRRINAQLMPGISLGEAVLKLAVEERTPYQIGTQISNDRSPSIGGLHGEIYGLHNNLSGWGDSLGVRYGNCFDGRKSGGDEVSLSYNIPLNAYDTSFRGYYDYAKSRVIEAPFDELDIKSSQETFGISISQPLLKTLAHEVRLVLAAETRQSESFLLGERFSFSEGVEDGESRLTAIRFAQEWQYRCPNQVFALYSKISLGIDALDATRNDTGPDGRFTAWLLQVQWARRFEKMNNAQLIFRTDLQLSDDPLLAMEKFSVGGAKSVRGYRENQLVRDKAVVSSLECRIPILRLPIPKLSKKPTDGIVQLAPFFDWGWAENVDQPTPDPQTISSIGLGLRWDPAANIHADIYWGNALTDTDNPHEDLQDHGFHFQFSASLF